MNITIRGRNNLCITAALKDHVEKHVGKVEKYFDKIDSATVLLSVIKNCHTVEVTLKIGGVILRGEETTSDMYEAVALVADKLERQIRKYKTRLEKRFKAGSLKTENMPEQKESIEEFNVVRRKQLFIKPLTVEEAILQMNMVNHDFFLFIDSETEKPCVVYKRKDGDYGLIESDC